MSTIIRKITDSVNDQMDHVMCIEVQLLNGFIQQQILYVITLHFTSLHCFYWVIGKQEAIRTSGDPAATTSKIFIYFYVYCKLCFKHTVYQITLYYLRKIKL